MALALCVQHAFVYIMIKLPINNLSSIYYLSALSDFSERQQLIPMFVTSLGFLSIFPFAGLLNGNAISLNGKMLLKVLYAQHLTAGNKVMIMVRDIEQNLMNALCNSISG